MAKPMRRKPALKFVPPTQSALKGVPMSEINYKNIDLLKKFIQDRGKIRSREITGITVQEQRLISAAIKNARELALLPFVQNVRGSRLSRGGRNND